MRFQRKPLPCWMAMGLTDQRAAVAEALLAEVEALFKKAVDLDIQMGSEFKGSDRAIPDLIRSVVSEAEFRLFVLPFRPKDFRTKYLAKNTRKAKKPKVKK